MILQYISTLIPLIVLDGVWLTLNKGFYARELGALFAPKVLLTPVVIFYLLYAVGILYFVVHPGVVNATSLLKVFLIGGFLGFIGYSCYDLTNYATIKDWSPLLTVVDLAWGTFVTGATSVLAVVLIRFFL